MNNFNDFKISGVVIPLLTPFTPTGAPNLPALESHIAWLIDRGVGGLMPCGTTGEGPLLTQIERETLIEKTVAVASGRVPVMAHVGCITTEETIHLAQFARNAGADAVSVVTPFYYHVSDRALVDHYTRIADSVKDCPVFLYTIPHCTSNDLSLEVVDAICSNAPNVIGLKDSSGNLDQMLAYTKCRNGQFQVICGSDGLLLDALKGGAAAGVSGNANIFPEIVVNLIKAWQAGKIEQAQTYQKTLDTIRTLLQDGGNLSLMKRALKMRGLFGGKVRPPLPEADPKLIQKVQQALISNQLIEEGN